MVGHPLKKENEKQIKQTLTIEPESDQASRSKYQFKENIDDMLNATTER